MSIFSGLPDGAKVDTALSSTSQNPVSSAAVAAALEGMVLLSGTGAPTTATIGAVGQEYYDTATKSFYKCVAHSTSEGSTLYTWVAVSASGGNEAEFGTRGPVIFAESGTFDIADYGLAIGDKVNVVAIGGGGGGGGGYTAGLNAGTAGGYGGGGRGGTGGYNGDSYSAEGGGGGSGFVAEKTIVLDATSIPITIGAAGAGGTAIIYYTSGTKHGGTGSDGGTTSFGTYLTAEGGRGGTGGKGSSTKTYGTGGAGGTYGNDGKINTPGAGGNGITVAGPSAITTTSDAAIKGSGAVFIWY